MRLSHSGNIAFWRTHKHTKSVLLNWRHEIIGSVGITQNTDKHLNVFILQTRTLHMPCTKQPTENVHAIEQCVHRKHASKLSTPFARFVEREKHWNKSEREMINKNFRNWAALCAVNGCSDETGCTNNYNIWQKSQVHATQININFVYDMA